MSNRKRGPGISLFCAWGFLLAASWGYAANCAVPSGTYTTIQSAINDSSCTEIDVAAGTYNEHLFITRTVTIQGDTASPTVIDYTGYSGSVIEGNGLTITLNHLTLTGGSQIGGGGGLRAVGTSTITLNMNYCTVSGNTATVPDPANQFGALGGGIFLSSATLNLFNSTVAGNTAQAGTTPGVGGGIYANLSTVNIVSSTIADNVAEGGGTTSGGGIFSHVTSATLADTIVAGNTGGNCSGTMTDNGYNMSDDATCGFSAGTSQNSVATLNLGALASNGGPTQTIALGAASAAIDQIPDGTSGCGTTVPDDQRGVARPQNGMCDIGAFEVVVATAPCPKGQGFWKNAPDAWPVDSLTLGSESYTEEELIALLEMNNRKDASLILADQLIAAKLNVLMGSDEPSGVADAIAQADTLLSGLSGKLPYGVRSKTALGQMMVSLGATLESYNLDVLTPICAP
jgi:hypothetical protein